VCQIIFKNRGHLGTFQLAHDLHPRWSESMGPTGCVNTCSCNWFTNLRLLSNFC